MSSALQGTMAVGDLNHVSLTQRFARLKERILQGRGGCVWTREFNFSDAGKSLQGSSTRNMRLFILRAGHLGSAEAFKPRPTTPKVPTAADQS